jgi:hypothetical protein
MKAIVFFSCIWVLMAMTAGCAAAPDAVHSQELVVEAPTVHCLGVRWYVGGDENANASVQLSYREKGERSWHQAMDLFRVGTGPDSQEGERRLESGGRDEWPFPLGNLFAGSVFDLKPDTPYELRLALSDPDGGKFIEEVQARTRAIPVPPKPRRTLHVTPGSGGGSGTQEDPLRGLEAADAAARPGDLLLLHRGVYQGPWETRSSGAPGAPIVWRAAGDGEVVVDGGGTPRAVGAHQTHDLFFQGLTFRNADYLFVAHGASDLTVQRCRFYQCNYGFTAHNNEPVMRGFYIADNVFEGPSTWPRTKGIESVRAIQVSGEGHDICYNRIHGFGDGIDIMGSPPGRAIDFYNNEISECTDDAIELDYGQTNVRAFRNRITNCFEGISTQPLYGGPAYVFRNSMYNLEYTPFKMHNRPSGVLLFHNTVVKSGVPWPLYSSAAVGKAVSRNNLFVGGPADNAMEFNPLVEEADFDYDGFAGGPFEMFGKWRGERYGTLDDFQTHTGIEPHAVWLGQASPFASGIKAPADFKEQFSLAVNDLSLNPHSQAVDAGIALRGLNDDRIGEGPDLGAYELRQALPHYGPR